LALDVSAERRHSSRHFPLVTLGIIALNVWWFLHEVRLGPDLDHFLFEWGLVPVRYTNSRISSLFSLRNKPRPRTSMFLLAAWMHLLGNMWTLWILATTSGSPRARAATRCFILWRVGRGGAPPLATPVLPCPPSAPARGGGRDGRLFPNVPAR